MSLRRVTILTETYAPVVGGGEMQAARLAEGLARRGVGVTLVTRRVARDLPARESAAGVAIRRVPPAGRGTLRKWALALTTIPELLGEVGASDVLVVCGYRILGMPARLVALASSLPCVFKADSQGEMSGAYFRPGLARLGLAPESAALRPLCAVRRRLVGGAQAYVAISSPLRDELLRAGVPTERVHDIPNGVDHEAFSPAGPPERAALRRDLGLPAEAFVACYTGRLVEYKGLATLLAAWETARPSLGEARLLLVGEGGLDVHDCEAALRRFAAERGLERSVRFVGAVPDVAPWLRASDAFVFPTRREAFGLALVEAMACGLTCISTAVGGLSDFVADGANALVVPPDDPEALAAALRRAAADRELARTVRAGARRTAVERFSDDIVVGAWHALLADVAGREIA